MNANFRDDIIVYGFRHAMRDRLSAGSCQSEKIDKIGGWPSCKIGQKYGDRFQLVEYCAEMHKINDMSHLSLAN